MSDLDTFMGGGGGGVGKLFGKLLVPVHYVDHVTVNRYRRRLKGKGCCVQFRTSFKKEIKKFEPIARIVLS